MLALAVVGLSAAGPALGHQSPDLEIEQISKRISAEPGNADLLLRRGQLYRIRARWTDAIGDLQAAFRLDPELVVVELALAETLFDAGDLPLALAAADRYVVAAPGEPAGHRIRARILAARGDQLAAADAFTRSIDLARANGSRGPQPDDYLGRARALAAAGNVEDAIAGLDDGLATLGAAITLELAAIELEIGAARWDAALVRLARIESRANRKETWISRRGEVLAAAGRTDEARRAFEAALAEIDRLPDHLRNIRATTELAATLRRRLADSVASTSGPSEMEPRS